MAHQDIDFSSNLIDSGKPIVEVTNLTKVYDNGVEANVNINLQVSQGEIYGVVGPNGAGKTTLIRQLTGELLPNMGEVWINGVDVVKSPEKIKGIIGVCPQEASLFSYLKVFEQLYYFARLKGLNRAKASEKVSRVLKDLNLDKHKNKIISNLSGGLKRKVFVALAILNEPPILLLDEPTTGLDPGSRREVWHFIEKMHKEKRVTIILTTHYMEEAEYLCDRIAIINNGKIIQEGTYQELKNKLRYNLKIKVSPHIAQEIKTVLGKIDHKIVETSAHVTIFLNRKSAKKIGLMNLILDVSDIDVTLTQPSLEDVYLEMIGYEDIKSLE